MIAPMMAIVLSLGGIPLPGTDVQWLEKRGDPVRLTAYHLDTTTTYLRNLDGDGFVKHSDDVEVSPDATKTASVPGTDDALILRDRVAGTTKKVPTVKAPLKASEPFWSDDGKRIVLTVFRNRTAVGYTVVDVATSTARTVRLRGLGAYTLFMWTPDNLLFTEYGDGARYHRPGDGKVLRAHPKVGLNAGGFSPSGHRLAMWCPSTVKETLCLVSPLTGKTTRRVPIKDLQGVLGWWDDKHVIAVVPYRTHYRAVLSDLRGNLGRVLADLPYDTWGDLWVSFARRTAPGALPTIRVKDASN